MDHGSRDLFGLQTWLKMEKNKWKMNKQNRRRRKRRREKFDKLWVKGLYLCFDNIYVFIGERDGGFEYVFLTPLSKRNV